MDSTPGYKALRRGRRSISGQAYLLTIATHQRQRIFASDNAAITAARVCHQARTWGDARPLCWVVMPDHWHGLLQLGERDSLALCVNRFKALVVKALRNGEGVDGRVWQEGFQDQNRKSGV